ncbi:MAG: DUF1997 domain-containing protein [Methylacidiphilales bacterium]|nr:DUF1997 domain-containing protein [Candidatus Methylacidiphilales bacterium]
MLSRDQEYQAFETNEQIVSVTSSLINAEDVIPDAKLATPAKFYGHYSDRMDMYAPASTVAKYLDSHNEWFGRCAEPMKVQPLGQNGYALVIGKFGSFNYEVEPKIGLELLPPEEGVYRIRTIPIPNYTPPGYDVDYRARMQLVENLSGDFSSGSSHVTGVEWELDLIVYIHFPKFIHRLPQSLIQNTGDKLLNQIVRQVSRRLTRKVQENFHQSIGINLPKKR